MKKFPIDIETDGLVLEALGLCDVQALDAFVLRWDSRMNDPFVARLADAYDSDGTLEAYTVTSFYRHRVKQGAEYIITKLKDDGEKEMVGYFNLQIHKNIGETFIWIAPPFRKDHVLSRSLKAVEKTFFLLGLKSIQSQCYFKNPYFPVVCNVMKKNNHQIIKEGQASISWEKTADMWRAENEKTPADGAIQSDTVFEPIYDEEIKTAELKLKVFEPIPKNAVTLLKFAKSAVDEKGYRPTCLNVACLKSALFALQTTAELKKEQKFCEYFVHAGQTLVGIIALREERFDEDDDRLEGLPKCHRGRKASCFYWMHPAYRGNGYMSESLKLVKESFFAHGGELLKLDIYSDNKASAKVAQKAGFKYHECVGHYLTRADFELSRLNGKVAVSSDEVTTCPPLKAQRMMNIRINKARDRSYS